MTKHNITRIIALGLALFSVFFGAGNILFPPFLGITVGKSYILGSLGFILTAVLISQLTALLGVKYNGDYIKFYMIAGRWYAIFMAVISFIVLCLIIAIPRTATTFYELSVVPFYDIPQIYIMLIYFIVVFIMVYSKSHVMDILSKFLTPILIITLALFILKGIFIQVPEITVSKISNPFTFGLYEGYLTMDAICTVIIVSLLWEKMKTLFPKQNELKKYTTYSIIACALTLSIMYAGLIYVSARLSSLPDIANVSSRAELLRNLANVIGGEYGKLLMALIIFATCVSTSIGLTSVGASMIERLTKGKLNYTFMVIFICTCSFIVATYSLKSIIAFSIPILFIIYPPNILMMFFGYTSKYFNKNTIKIVIYSITFYVAFLEILKILKVNLGKFDVIYSNISWIPLFIILTILVEIYYRKIKIYK